MAKTFYYDSVGLLESTINDGSGSDSGSLYTFSDGTTLTNEEYAIDQNISNAVSGWVQHEGLQFDLGSAKAVDFFAVYFNSDEADNIVIEYDSASTGESETRSAAITTNFSADAWFVSEFTEATKQYWRIFAASVGGLEGLSEVIFGKKLAFEMYPDIGIGEQEIYGTGVQRSIGGVEYAIKKHDPISTISMNFSSVSSTFKDNLQSMEAQVTDYKKFIYSEDGTTGPFHYVRLDGPISYSEVAYQRFSASFTLREQLS